MNPALPYSPKPNKLFIVTGGNSGLGLETARKLAARSRAHTVVLACRNPSKAAEAALSIVRTTGNSSVQPMELDLSSLDSVRRFAEQMHHPVYGILCNAGIANGPTQTADGIDAVFETNHLGHFLLVSLLLDRLASDGRVISVSSDMHRPPGPKLRWPGAEALARPSDAGGSRRRRYGYSKLCNLYFTYELSRRLRTDGSTVASAAFNPGLMTSTNFATMPSIVGGLMERLFAGRVGDLNASSSALAELATTADGQAIDGFYFDRTAAEPSRSSALSYSESKARELWDVSSRLTGAGY